MSHAPGHPPPLSGALTPALSRRENEPSLAYAVVKLQAYSKGLPSTVPRTVAR